MCAGRCVRADKTIFTCLRTNDFSTRTHIHAQLLQFGSFTAHTHLCLCKRRVRTAPHRFTAIAADTRPNRAATCYSFECRIEQNWCRRAVRLQSLVRLVSDNFVLKIHKFKKITEKFSFKKSCRKRNRNKFL